MEYATIAGNYYTITSKSGCSVTDATGTLSMTVDAGGQLTVQAPSDKLVLDDEQAIVFKANFKSALAALGLLGLLGGGDSSRLPDGYLQAYFLESDQGQYINTEYVPTENTGLMLKAYTRYNNDCVPFGSRNNSRETRFACVRQRCGGWIGGSVGYGWDSWNTFEKEYPSTNVSEAFYKGLLNWKNSRKATFESLFGNDKREADLPALVTQPRYPMYIFAINMEGQSNYFLYGRIFTAGIRECGSVKSIFLPAVTAEGEPCFYDTGEHKRALKNSGTGRFIVGMTLAQARKLGKLPATGGTLTVSLPSNYAEDEGVVNALATAQENGWVITIQTYEAEAGAVSTFALRRIWVRKRADENGSYVDTDGFRWQVDWCVDIIGSDPETEGYEPFRSVEAATEYWGLTAWIAPEQEELLTEA